LGGATLGQAKPDWGGGQGARKACPGPDVARASEKRWRSHLTESVLKVVLQESIPPQIRQLILYYYLYKQLVDEFVWELTFAK